MRKTFTVPMVVLSLSVSVAAQAQSDPFANLRGVANSVKALGRIGKKPAVSTAEDGVVVAESSRSDGSTEQISAAEGATNRASTQIVKGDAATFDIGGIKLGMSPSEVERVAKMRKLKLSDLNKSHPSYEQAVASKMKEMRNQYAPLVFGSTAFVRLQDDQGSSWGVHFNITREGPRTYMIQYETPLNGRTPAGFATSLIEKYGPPKGGPSRMSERTYYANWCTGPRTACTYSGDGTRPAYLEANMETDKLRLRLEISYAQTMALENAIRDQAQANLAKTAPKVTF